MTMTTLAPPFEYSPLQEPRHIRLLRLYPGLSEDPLSCELEHVSLDDGPSYEAISYVWGDPTFSHSLLCGTGRVAVTGGLNVVLRRIRLEDNVRTVWIDGVCINQTDTRERGYQVGLMGDIFRMAQQVVIWLGEDDWGLAEYSLTACVKISMSDVKRTDSEQERSEKMGRRVSPLRHLAERSWFQRTWVLQELVLAKSATVLWGDVEIPWEHIDRAIHNVTLYRPIRYVEAGFALNRVETFIEIKRKCDSSEINFLSALRWTHGLHSVDPRDKIYALLGILSESKIATTSQIAKLIEPDYAKDVRLVYEDFALTAARFGMAGDLIRSVHHESTLARWTRQSIPSWAPDWTRIPRRGRTYRSFVTMFSQLGYEDVLPVNTGTKCLLGHSIKFANIEIVSEEADHRDSTACFNIIAEFWHSNTARVDYTSMVDDKIMIAHFAEAIIEGSDLFSGDFSPGTSSPILGEILHCIFEDSQASYNDKPEAYTAARVFLDLLTEYYGPPSDSDRWVRRERLTLYPGLPERQRLFVTDTNYVGLGPAAMRPGDVVKFLPGTCMPMVLRPQDDFYQLVGGCYVSGLMDLSSEELVKVCRDFKVERIEIR